MRDDLPREGPAYERYGGFESGLRHSDGEVKPAFDGFRLPLVAERGHRTRLWGLVRPAAGQRHGADRVPQPRLVALAHAQARPHRYARLLGDDDVVPIRTLVPRALGGFRRITDAGVSARDGKPANLDSISHARCGRTVRR